MHIKVVAYIDTACKIILGKKQQVYEAQDTMVTEDSIKSKQLTIAKSLP